MEHSPFAAAENTVCQQVRAACSDNYIPMREHPKRLYEQTHSGAVHSSHFIQKPLGERLLSAAEIWQRDGLRATLYETGGFLEKAVTLFDNYQKWGYSTEPMGNFVFPDSSELLLTLTPGLSRVGDYIGEKLASTLPPAIMGSLLSLGEKIELPSGTAMPYETTFGRIALGVTGVLVIFDVANTWTEDSGNSNFKRLQKTGIQIVGGAVTVAGGMASASLIAMGGAGASATGGASVVIGIAGATVANVAVSMAVQWGQNIAYEWFDIY